MSLFGVVIDWFLNNQEQVSLLGIEPSLDRSREAWEKGSISLALIGDERMATMSLWNSGEIQLDMAVVEPERVDSFYREARSPDDVAEELAKVIRWMGIPEASETG
jgi:hypothetical protein